ncbi:hypothetical protein [Dietzia sp. CH92]|uniref:hypothetical protein n=1 Tax=Dietzia sp. CH92 TaxID=3051823 RepID=UPI0028D5D6DE|nr:hypothetical protein [Dietzia sp. CH92]
MNKSTDANRDVPAKLFAPRVGQAPYKVSATLLTFLHESPDAVLAEAETKDGSTNWRLYWLEGDVVGLVEASAAVEGWANDTQDDVTPDISVTMVRLSAVGDIQFDVAQTRLDQWGSGHQVTGTMIVETGVDSIRIPQQPSGTAKADQVSDFHSALLEAWRG